MRFLSLNCHFQTFFFFSCLLGCLRPPWRLIPFECLGTFAYAGLTFLAFFFSYEKSFLIFSRQVLKKNHRFDTLALICWGAGKPVCGALSLSRSIGQLIIAVNGRPIVCLSILYNDGQEMTQMHLFDIFGLKAHSAQIKPLQAYFGFFSSFDYPFIIFFAFLSID